MVPWYISAWRTSWCREYSMTCLLGCPAVRLVAECSHGSACCRRDASSLRRSRSPSTETPTSPQPQPCRGSHPNNPHTPSAEVPPACLGTSRIELGPFKQQSCTAAAHAICQCDPPPAAHRPACRPACPICTVSWCCSPCCGRHACFGSWRWAWQRAWHSLPTPSSFNGCQRGGRHASPALPHQPGLGTHHTPPVQAGIAGGSHV